MLIPVFQEQEDKKNAEFERERNYLAVLHTQTQ